ncbi:MAG: hypothetical protein H6573_23470 [Lewinellaceae bacterium]|nr:hypothetical protein [Phaeodactylibacter sp.]MCB0613606.1 hypothetical protein [Phaeodactylibacter sp.]MCB9350449.1 hypothetical protein [Lewinellaceae bacterium]
MKNLLFLLTFISTVVIFTNCNKDEKEDLTIEVVGDFKGAFGSNSVGEINPYEIVVSRVNKNTVSIRPKSGNEFSEIEIEIERFNSSTISSPTDNNQQLDKSVIFAIGTPVTINMQIGPIGDAIVFIGEKQ